MTAGDAVPADAVLEVSGLTVAAVGRGRGRDRDRQDPLPLVQDVSFRLAPGETLGLVGESGSGKTVTALGIMRLLARSLRITAGSVRLQGEDLVQASERRLRAVRGNDIAMVFQEPMTSLNPAFTVGNQIAEAVTAHTGMPRAAAWQRAVEVLELVGIPRAARRIREYPHAFSGGMRQRVMIAMALACEPRVLVADEPTTAVDVTIQAQILDLLRRLQAELGMAILFVTHDLGVVADVCDRVCVLYAGQVVEQAEVHAFFDRPWHPYSAGLLDAMPQSCPPGGRLHVVAGTVPTPDALPAGCRFHPRCEHAQDACSATDPELLPVASGGLARCLRQHELHLGDGAGARS
ncbi:MAG TPA: ABC transporter ATP-binding protein [Acidimicrobiales bacterium]|nr:ABC transporter ATP-binding protein [Acidimicrobiales bacterium]